MTTFMFVVASVYAAVLPDSKKLEQELQSLSWSQFRAVIEAVPSLKAEVDRHGTGGWKLVQARYQTHPWRKSIDKLDIDQKRQLAILITKSRSDDAQKPGSLKR